MMNRRSFLMTIAATLIPKVIRVSTPLSLYGIPYHAPGPFHGTWLGIERSTVPFFRSTYPYEELTKLVTKMELNRGPK